MATTDRVKTPSEHFSAAPHTPTSISSAATAGEQPSLLRPHADKLDRHATSLSPRSTPLPLTGAAAMAELKRRKQQQHNQNGSRQTSPNPQVQAMQSLLGTGGISRPQDAPATDKMSEPLRIAAEKVNMNADSGQEISPSSLGSFGSTLEGAGITATSNDAPGQFVAEPAQMTEGQGYAENNGHLAVQDQDPNKQMSLSYPGPPPQDPNQEAGPSRSMTLPGFGQASPKSPASNKRHKCPYCNTGKTGSKD